MIFIIKLILFKKQKKTKKRGKPHSIEIKLLTNIWCSEVNTPASKLFLWGDGWSRQLEPPGGPEGEDPLHLAQTRQGPYVGLSKDSQSVNHIPHFYAGLIVVLFLYGGSNLGSGLGPDLIRTQCFLILSLSVNKITECFDKAVHEGDDCDVCLLPPAHPTPRPS